MAVELKPFNCFFCDDILKFNNQKIKNEAKVAKT
jgi:hypothetical protein